MNIADADQDKIIDLTKTNYNYFFRKYDENEKKSPMQRKALIAKLKEAIEELD